MILDLLMSRYEWEAVWFLGRNGSRTLRGCAFVGTWTGEDNDLICVRQCESNVEAERWLAPEGYTILDAALRSVLYRASGGRVFLTAGIDCRAHKPQVPQWWPRRASV